MCGCCDGEKEEAPAPKPRPLSRKNVCCTDIVFLIIFVAFVGLMVYIAVVCFMQGDARRLVFGYDSFGNTCNQDNTNNKIPNITYSGYDLTGKDNVLFMNVFDPFDAMQVCVSKCPDRDLRTPPEVKAFAEETGSQLCNYDIPVDEYGKWEHYKDDGSGPCPRLPVFKSISLLQRCAPDPTALIKSDDKVEAVGSSMDVDRRNATDSFFRIFELDNLFRKVLSDLYMAWWELICLCIIAIILSFLVVIFIRFLAPIIVWLIVILAGLGSLVGTGFLWWTFADIHRNLDKRENWRIPLLGVEVSNEKAFLAFSIIATVLTVVLLLIILILRKRIGLAVALFKEAGQCLIDLPSLLIQPVWTFIILAAFFAYWLAVLAFIGTSGHPKARYDRGFQSVEFVLEGFASHFWWIHLIGLIWISEVILACQQFVIGGSVAIWYFTRDKKKVGCACCSAISSLILHHIGSVALGALIITLVKIPRYILMYINSKLEGKENGCAKCCAKCCICCLWCLEKILKFLNQNAYTIIAMEGISFCSAAKKAFSIITSNVLRVAAINSVGAFVLFLGKIGVTASTCAIAVVWLKGYEQLHFYAIPVFIVSVFAFLSAHCALSVYEMVVDALLLSFCEDVNINDGTEGKEYYMNHSLMEYVKDTSSTLDRIKKKKRSRDETDAPIDAKEMKSLTKEEDEEAKPSAEEAAEPVSSSSLPSHHICQEKMILVQTWIFWIVLFVHCLQWMYFRTQDHRVVPLLYIIREKFVEVNERHGERNRLNKPASREKLEMTA